MSLPSSDTFNRCALLLQDWPFKFLGFGAKALTYTREPPYTHLLPISTGLTSLGQSIRKPRRQGGQGVVFSVLPGAQ